MAGRSINTQEASASINTMTSATTIYTGLEIPGPQADLGDGLLHRNA